MRMLLNGIELSKHKEYKNDIALLRDSIKNHRKETGYVGDTLGYQRRDL